MLPAIAPQHTHDTFMITLRPITPSDVASVAALHAASWRSAYRGIVRDDFLDGDLIANRQALWSRRLGTELTGSPASFGFLAWSDDAPVGFAYAYPGADAKLGCLIDNLHVLPSCKGQGIGSRLLEEVGRQQLAQRGDERLHLCVFEANVAARRFYESLQARPIERQVVEVRGGGTAPEWVYAWPTAQALLQALAARHAS